MNKVISIKSRHLGAYMFHNFCKIHGLTATQKALEAFIEDSEKGGRWG